jgi:hypothetical protein
MEATRGGGLFVARFFQPGRLRQFRLDRRLEVAASAFAEDG